MKILFTLALAAVVALSVAAAVKTQPKAQSSGQRNATATRSMDSQLSKKVKDKKKTTNDPYQLPSDWAYRMQNIGE